MTGLKILLLCHRPVRENAKTVTDHIGAFRRHSRHSVLTVSIFGALPRGLDLGQFDVLVVHYTLVAALDSFLNPDARDRIARFSGLKAQFIQDEYRFVNATIEASRRLGIDVLFTCVPESEVEKVYSSAALPGTRKISVLTGYVPDDLLAREVPPIAARAIDVGYRSRQLPYWLGELGMEKHRIAQGFLEAAGKTTLVCDVSSDESRRLYGKRWIGFLTSCKAVLGSESGASVFDFTGEIQRSVETYLEHNPAAEFEEVRQRFFAAHEGRIRLNQISPRCFEASALRAAMVLFEGEYSGVLKPWRHFIPLRKDFGNIDSVLEILRDPAQLQVYSDLTFSEVAQNPAYSYARLVSTFDDIIEEEYTIRIGAPRTAPDNVARLLRWHVATPLALKWQRVREYRARVAYPLMRVVVGIWSALPEPIRQRARPFVRSLRALLTTPLRLRS